MSVLRLTPQAPRETERGMLPTAVEIGPHAAVAWYGGIEPPGFPGMEFEPVVYDSMEALLEDHGARPEWYRFRTAEMAAAS